MTTTVRVMIEGNKACEVKVVQEGYKNGAPAVVKPGNFVSLTIHGEQAVMVKETGDFL